MNAGLPKGRTAKDYSAVGRFVKPSHAPAGITLTYAPERISITGETA